MNVLIDDRTVITDSTKLTQASRQTVRNSSVVSDNTLHTHTFQANELRADQTRVIPTELQPHKQSNPHARTEQSVFDDLDIRHANFYQNRETFLTKNTKAVKTSSFNQTEKKIKATSFPHNFSEQENPKISNKKERRTLPREIKNLDTPSPAHSNTQLTVTKTHLSKFQELFNCIEEFLETVLIGKKQATRICLTAAIAGGHILLVDPPGTGKTKLAHALSKSLKLQYKRIQFTPDLIPSDLTGGTVFQQTSSKFIFRPGPIFTQMLLADGIDQASPKVQSALLEVMEEQQITIDGHIHKIKNPFTVIATQDRGRQSGNYPLSEAQLDRFLISVSLGNPSHEASLQILQASNSQNTNLSSPALNSETLHILRSLSNKVYVSSAIYEYIVRILEASRHNKLIQRGCSIRGGLDLVRCSRIWAASKGRDYVIPKDITDLMTPILSHRIQLSPQAQLENIDAQTALEESIKVVPVPHDYECRQTSSDLNYS